MKNNNLTAYLGFAQEKLPETIFPNQNRPLNDKMSNLLNYESFTLAFRIWY